MLKQTPQNLAGNGLCTQGLRFLVSAMESNDTIEKLNITGVKLYLKF